MAVVTRGTPDRRYAQAYVSGIAAETFPAHATATGSTGASPTAGVVHLRRITLDVGAYTTVTYCIGNTQGATLANTFFGLYDMTNARLAQSADLSASMAAVGTFTEGTATLSYTTTAAGDYWLALLIGSAVTMPAFVNLGMAAFGIYSHSPLVIAKSGTGQTSLPATITPAAPTTSSNFWFRYA